MTIYSVKKKSTLSICDTQVLEFQFILKNVLFLRWHYPDQVLGFKVNTLRLSQLYYQRPFSIVFISLLLIEKNVKYIYDFVFYILCHLWYYFEDVLF